MKVSFLLSHPPPLLCLCFRFQQISSQLSSSIFLSSHNYTFSERALKMKLFEEVLKNKLLMGIKNSSAFPECTCAGCNGVLVVPPGSRLSTCFPLHHLPPCLALPASLFQGAFHPRLHYIWVDSRCSCRKAPHLETIRSK